MRIGAGDVSASDDEGNVLISKNGRNASKLSMYRLKNGRAHAVGALTVKGQVKDIVAAKGFDGFRFAINTFERTRSGDVMSQVKLIRITAGKEDSRAVPVPELSGLALLTRPGGLAFGMAASGPKCAASVFLSGPALSVLQQVPGLSTEELQRSYVILISGTNVVRCWPIMGPASGGPVAWSADGTNVLLRVEDCYLLADTSTGEAHPYVRSGWDRILAADASLKHLICASEDRVFWATLAGEHRLLMRCSRPTVAAIADNGSAVTDGHFLWLVNHRGVEAKLSISRGKAGQSPRHWYHAEGDDDQWFTEFTHAAKYIVSRL
jgi:hypothetical protein